METHWQDIPSGVALEQDVHLWRASLNLSKPVLADLYSLLSEDERERAGKFYFERDCQHFVAGRGVLRILVSYYTGQAPEWLEFEYGPQGKPTLVSSASLARLNFNLAHSGELALYAFNYERPIGVDLEYIRSEIDLEEIAAHFFEVSEQVALRELPAHLRRQAFYSCWTRKEAFIKAVGLGLSLPLECFAVSVTPGDDPIVLKIKDKPQAAKEWVLREVDAGKGYMATLAVRGHGWELKSFNWRPYLFEV